MFDAKQAREKIGNVKEVKDTEEMGRVKSLLFEAIENEKEAISIDGTLRLNTQLVLEELGYVVNRVSYRNETTTTILVP